MWWLILLAVPAGLYFVLIALFGVNIVFEDSWNTVVMMLGQFANGHLSLGGLWVPHNGNRILFPYLLFLLIDLGSRYNATADLYVSAALMSGAMLILCWLIVRSTGLRGLFLVPVALLFLSPVQVSNVLWDFQLTWALAAFALMACLAFVELSEQRPYLWILAAISACVASFSLLQGLLVWPAALIFAWARGVRWPWLALWLLAAVPVVVVYFWGLGPLEPASWAAYPAHHLSSVLRFLLAAAGNYMPRFHSVAGVAVLIASIGLAAVAWRFPQWRSPLRLCLALTFVGLAFVLMIAWGRSVLGPGEALSSRYTSFTLYLPISLYVAAALYWRETRRGTLSLIHAADALSSRLLISVAVLGILVQFAWSVPSSMSQGQMLRGTLDRDAVYLRHYRTATDSELQQLFAPGGEFVRRWAPILEEHRWSVFADGPHQR